MSMHRSNKGPPPHGLIDAPWFVHNVKRQRARKKIARRSRQINRRIARDS